MNQTYEGIFIAFILFLIVYLNFLAARRIYYYFKSYSKEIYEFLKENELSLIEIIKPNSTDWKTNPFETKDSHFFELALPFSIRTHYYFTVENEKDEVNEYWIRNRTPLFGKIKTEFQIAKIKRPKLDFSEYSKGICPACSAKIEIKEKECHDCGLVFE